MSDLQRDVLNALYWDLAVPRNRIKVRIEEGWVTLSGEVNLPYERKCAEADVLKVPGVIGVRNLISVHSDANSGSARGLSAS